MRYRALCCDYDGTLARQGRVAEPTVQALRRVRASGRKLLLVTGRQLDDLATVFARLDLFDQVVAENGAVLHQPHTGDEQLLGGPPPREFVDALKARGVSPLAAGRVIVATTEPYGKTIVATIRELGLRYHVIYNKGAVMVLPAGINKASGLAAALDALQLPRQQALAVGDAENDVDFLRACGCGIAVANAVPQLVAVADFVTRGSDGDGVRELIDELLKDDLRSRAVRGAGS